MKWSVIFQPENLALYGEGILTTLGLLFASLGIGAVLALIFALALTGPGSVSPTISAPARRRHRSGLDGS